MRQIKYRVWDSLLKQMFQWGDVNEGQKILLDAFNGDDAIALQFTGIDNIYESDIIEDHNGVGVVEYVEMYAAFRVNYANGYAKWFYDYNLKGERDSIHVIGNIYQNPELLPHAAI